MIDKKFAKILYFFHENLDIFSRNFGIFREKFEISAKWFLFFAGHPILMSAYLKVRSQFCVDIIVLFFAISW